MEVLVGEMVVLEVKKQHLIMVEVVVLVDILELVE